MGDVVNELSNSSPKVDGSILNINTNPYVTTEESPNGKPILLSTRNNTLLQIEESRNNKTFSKRASFPDVG